MTIGGGERAVGSGEAKPKKPGFFAISSLAFDIVGCPLGVVVSGITFGHFSFATVERDELVIVVITRVLGEFGAIPYDLVVPIATVACIRAGVPFSDMSGGVSSFLERRHPEWRFFRIVFATWIVAFHAHRLYSVLQFPGQEGSSSGHAPCAVVGMFEANAAGCQSIDVRRVDPWLRSFVATDGPVGLIVRVDVEDVRFVRY